MTVRQKKIRSLVANLLKENAVVSPPVDPNRVANHLGLKIKKETIGRDISGFLYRSGAQSIIGVNERHQVSRQRFTIAHEIGHFLLHSGESGEVHIDRVRTIDIKFRDKASSTGSYSDEREANQFAAELLMPEDFLREDLSKNELGGLSGDKLVQYLAKRYRVSSMAMTLRLSKLELLGH